MSQKHLFETLMTGLNFTRYNQLRIWHCLALMVNQSEPTTIYSAF